MKDIKQVDSKLLRPTYKHMIRYLSTFKANWDFDKVKRQPSYFKFINIIEKNPSFYWETFIYLFRKTKTKSFFNKEGQNYWWMLDNPTDYDSKRHRRNSFYNDEVVKHNLSYHTVHRMIICMRAVGYIKVVNPTLGENATATHLYFQNPSEWKMDGVTTMKEWMEITLPTYLSEIKTNSNSAVVRDKFHYNDGSLVEINSRSKKPKKLNKDSKDDNKKGWERPALKSIQKQTDYFNSFIPLKEFHLQRIFEYDESHKMLKGGRFYGIINRMPSKDRRKFCHQFKLKEVDFAQNNLNIIHYCALGEKYQGDLYMEVVELMASQDKYKKMLENKNEWRKVIKTISIAVFGAYSRENARGSLYKQLSKIGIFDEQTWNKNYTHQRIYLDANDILDAIKIVYDKFAEYLYGNWNMILQNIESQMMTRLMKIMCKMNIMPLPVHDGFIVPQEHYDFFNKIKEEIFIEVCEKNKERINKKNNKEQEQQQTIIISGKDNRIDDNKNIIREEEDKEYNKIRNIYILYIVSYLFLVLKNNYGFT